MNMNTTIPSAKYKLSWIFVLLYFLPSFIFVYFKQSSLAVGITIISALVIGLNANYIAKKRVGKKGLLLFVSMILLLFIESSYSIIKWNDSKPMMTIPAIIAILVSAWSLSVRIAESDEKIVESSLKFALYVFLFFGWLAVFRTIDIGNYALKGKGAFPFSEDSHYALCSGFLSCIVGSVSSKKERIFILANITIQAVLFPNLTLLVFSFVCCFLFWFSKRLLAFFIIFLVAITSGAFVIQSMQGTAAGDYFLSRMDLSERSNNLTTLVFLQGIDDSRRAIEDTYGTGLGFQRAGTDEVGAYGYIIQSLTGGEYNRTDGGFLSSKVVTEFGFLGLTISLLYFLKIISSVKEYNSSENIVVKMAASALIAFSVEFFLRGYGYFSPSLILVVALALSAARIKKRS